MINIRNIMNGCEAKKDETKKENKNEKKNEKKDDKKDDWNEWIENAQIKA